MSAADEIYVFSGQTLTLIYASEVARANVGYPIDALRVMSLADLQPEISLDRFRRVLSPLLSGAQDQIIYRTTQRRRDKSEYPVEVRIQRLTSDASVQLIATVVDITERKRTQLELHKLSSVIEQTPNAVIITDTAGRVEYVNPCFTQHSGHELRDVLGKTLEFLQSPHTPAAVYKEMWDMARRGDVWRGEFQNRNKEGKDYWVAGSLSAILDEQRDITYYIAIQQDITEKKWEEERLNYLAYYDKLTGLPNRSLFNDRLHQAMIDAERHERLVAVMYLDLDRFKPINDSLGHEAGDKLLMEVAERLKQGLRATDTVSRIGGDEFAMVVTEMRHISDAVKTARKILDSIAEPYEIENRQLYVTASIGITIFPFDDNNIESLLKNADTAMYSAKEAGKNGYQFYSAEMTAQACERLVLENDLRVALTRDEFRLYYEPQMDAQGCKIIGMSAQLYWQHPQRGLLDGDYFMRIAEESGLMVPIGKWVLKQACSHYRALRELGHGSLHLAVSLSAQQLKETEIIDVVEKALEGMACNPSVFKLEVTESMLMEKGTESAAVLKSLTTLGLKLSINDFGRGYSPLIHLKRYPVDSIKIDASLINELNTDPDSAAITNAIISMAHSLDIWVIAAGVDTPEQFQFLQDSGCDVVQGGYVSEPVSLERLVAMLEEDRDCENRPSGLVSPSLTVS